MSQAEKFAGNLTKLKAKPDESKAAPQELQNDDGLFIPLSDSPPVSIDGRVVRTGRLPRKPKPPEAKFDRSYIPADSKAQRTRTYLLWHYDAGLSRHEHAEALLTQEQMHQSAELMRFTFGDIGEDSFLVRWAADAHLGDEEALIAWQELAASAVLHLREDGILLKMHKALEKVVATFNNRCAFDLLRFTASLFALKYREKTGEFPTKKTVREFLKSGKLELPENKNLPRLWIGPILGRLKNGTPGRRR